MDAQKLGNAFGYLITLLVAGLCGYAATVFVTQTFNPRDWTPAGRLIFMAMGLYVHPRLFNEE